MNTPTGKPAPDWLRERRAASTLAATESWMAPGVRRTDVSDLRLALFEPAQGDDPPVLFYAHGGGFRNGYVQTYASYASRLAERFSVRVALVQYRLAPEHPFPAGLEDVTAAYQWVTRNYGEPARTVTAGESAGGGLIAALLLELDPLGLPSPAGAALISPWVDLTCTAASYDTNAATEKLFPYASAVEAAAMYLGDTDPMTELASPLFGTWGPGHPPMLIRASAAEVLVDDATRLADTAAAAGVEVDVRLYADAPHAWPVVEPESAATEELLDELQTFIGRVVPTVTATEVRG